MLHENIILVISALNAIPYTAASMIFHTVTPRYFITRAFMYIICIIFSWLLGLIRMCLGSGLRLRVLPHVLVYTEVCCSFLKATAVRCLRCCIFYTKQALLGLYICNVFWFGSLIYSELIAEVVVWWVWCLHVLLYGLTWYHTGLVLCWVVVGGCWVTRKACKHVKQYSY